MNYGRRSGNLEERLVTTEAERFAQTIRVEIETIRALRWEGCWVRKTWNREEKCHSAQIFVCPQCLAGSEGAAFRTWQTKICFACSKHGRFLVGSCDNCGAPIRYRSRFLRTAVSHWRDLWPYCSSCGETIGVGEVVPNDLFEVNRQRESWLQNDAMHAANEGHLLLSCRVYSRLRNETEEAQILSGHLVLPQRAHALSAVCAKIVSAMLNRQSEDDPTRLALLDFCSGASYQLSAIMKSLR
jgi:hypothetical protein